MQEKQHVARSRMEFKIIFEWFTTGHGERKETQIAYQYYTIVYNR